jgi:cell fate regulator YaaT (PSP1 superfamily)
MTSTQKIVGVRFAKIGKIYHFDAGRLLDVVPGDIVVVETSRGWQLGQMTHLIPESLLVNEGNWKLIDRKATPRDLVQHQVWQQKEEEVVNSARKRAKELNLKQIKIISAEYSFDGSRLGIAYSTESEEKIDLKSLRQDMQRVYAPAQVELRQIGPRDVAKCMGGMGACGLEVRCCSKFLTEFNSISIRMAKEQSISLTPSEITGMCGRLRCCLIYEYQQYVDARQRLPKRNKVVRTPQGDGRVVDVHPLRGTILVELPEIGVREFPKEEVQLLDEKGNTQEIGQGEQPSDEKDVPAA